MSHANPVAQAVLGGWTLGNLVVFSTGGWESVNFTGADISNTNITSGRPDRVCDGNISNPTLSHWYDTSCFVRPPEGIGRFGNSGVNIIEGPAQNAWSTNVFKIFVIGERLKFRLNANFENVLNHPIFGWVIKSYGGDSGLDIESSSAGKICCQLNNQLGSLPANRTIVLGAKVQF